MEPDGIIVTWKKLQPGTREGLMVLATMVLLISVLLIWAVFLRKRRRRQHYHYPHQANGSSQVAGDPEGGSSKHRKRRRRHRDHRPRNPTLAETGGLPPIRPDGPPPMP